MPSAQPSRLAETAPRYTSYPTAPHFHAGIGEGEVTQWLDAVPDGDAVSLYLHIPFCDRLCWFCACHTRQTRKYEPVARFVRSLHAEIETVAASIGGRTRVVAIHFGGGSPTMLDAADFREVMARLRAAFKGADTAELSVEIDPNDMNEDKLDVLAGAGLTRASLGVQDFDPRVQQAINREQSFELTRAVVGGLRRRGVGSLNLDLLYGLPHQTVASVETTVAQALTLRPDRIALFGYAHVPWFKKHQTMIDEAWLPDGAARLEQSQAAARLIVEAGYVAIGIDHFALPADGLTLAARAGRLGRNFQGYTDDACETLIGLGPSSISHFRQGYAQNVAATLDYQRTVDAGRLAIARGVEFSEDDRVRGWVIERLMCDFGFSAGEALARFGDACRPVLAEAALLAQTDPTSLRAIGDRYEVPDETRPWVRTVAARFDSYLRQGAARHSLAV
jgi:oxygen-independent coproporphyrinogen-3 oxidase